ncbi:hypothetical protein FK268_06970 [Tsukamurella sputi]|uniref:Uncharacterized protein n=1 Tax=Tsukamurella sputi TaxID=2591848 RepID=A0A5C5RR13_9ACTN|nr:hypothetical protein [Tsukamurella sputi]TWS24973.1 hypothetical protein FK268_06970 [Tsukamurella sputi]
MGITVGVHPFVPAAELTVGDGFDGRSVERFVARWSLTPVPDSAGAYLTADDIADGMLPRITADTDRLAIDRPTSAEIDMAFDWMLTVGGTFFDYSGSALISADLRWLAVDVDEANSLVVFVVDDVRHARRAWESSRTPPGIWDVRSGFEAIPIVVRRPMADYSPELRWNGWLVILHDDGIEVQVVPDHGFWGVPLRDVEPGLTYRAENWVVRDVDGALRATHRDGRVVTVDAGADGPVIRTAP